MNKTEKALLLDLFHNYAKAKATGKYKEAEKIEADFLNVINALSLDERAQSLKANLEKLKKNLLEDKAGGASTMLHYSRNRLEELAENKRFLFSLGAIDIDEEEFLNDDIKEISDIIKARLQDRLFWIADRLEETIEARKKAGTYKGEFTIPVILANAFNDIFKVNEGYFTGDRNELKGN